MKFIETNYLGHYTYFWCVPDTSYLYKISKEEINKRSVFPVDFCMPTEQNWELGEKVGANHWAIGITALKDRALTKEVVEKAEQHLNFLSKRIMSEKMTEKWINGYESFQDSIKLSLPDQNPLTEQIPYLRYEYAEMVQKQAHDGGMTFLFSSTPNISLERMLGSIHKEVSQALFKWYLQKETLSGSTEEDDEEELISLTLDLKDMENVIRGHVEYMLKKGIDQWDIKKIKITPKIRFDKKFMPSIYTLDDQYLGSINRNFLTIKAYNDWITEIKRKLDRESKKSEQNIWTMKNQNIIR